MYIIYILDVSNIYIYAIIYNFILMLNQFTMCMVFNVTSGGATFWSLSDHGIPYHELRDYQNA